MPPSQSNASPITRKFDEMHKVAAGLVLAIVTALLIWAIYVYMPIGLDWKQAYYPASRELLALRSPYNEPNFMNPPWVILPLLPFALLPMKLGAAVMAIVNLACFFLVAIRLGAKPPAALAVLLSYPVLFAAAYGQVDGIAALGLLLPPQIGLFFVLIKPQFGVGIALYWLVDAWRKGGPRQVFFTFIPVTIAFLLSFALFGLWPLAAAGVNRGANTGLFPQLIPIGLVLLLYAIREHRRGPAIAASPFLSPYVAPHGWAISLLGLLPDTWMTVMAVIGIWIVRLLTSPMLY